MRGLTVDKAETPGFLGPVVLALANDTQIGARSDDTIVTAEAGAQYGITDEDGNVPESHRGAFGGGPVFGSGGALGG
ncbi:MAG: hypothetical protein ICV72_00415 [Aldersonia sp.]|nr:hypothetical protein [Aldersonia sp.]